MAIEADLHIHTNYSDGKYSPAEMIEAACKAKLDVLAITDHNTVSGVAQLEPERVRDAYGICLITGFELSLISGHYLVLGVTPHLVPDILEKYNVVERTYAEALNERQTKDILQNFIDLGGVIIAAHPCLLTSMSTRAETLIALHQQNLIHGAEDHNYEIERYIGLFYKLWHYYVKGILNKHGIPSFGNSDAHYIQHVGQRRNIFENTRPSDLLDHLRRPTSGLF